MRLSNGFVIDKEKTFGELKFTAVRDVFLQNEDGTPSTQLKKRIYDLKCSLHGGIIPVSVPPEVPLREFPYNAVVELVNPVADTVSRKTYTGADVDWYVKAEDIVLKNKGNQNVGSPQNNTQGQPKNKPTSYIFIVADIWNCYNMGMKKRTNFDLSTCLTKSENLFCNSIGGTINCFFSSFDFDKIPFNAIFISSVK